MRIQTFAVAFLAAGVVFGPCSNGARASFGISVLTFDETTGATGTNSDQTVGWAFDVNTDITVTSLQWFDDNGDGLTISHEVAIWTDTGVQLTKAVIPAGTAALLRDGQWRTVKIPELTLSAGQRYVIGGFNGFNAVDRIAAGVTQSVVPEISWVESRFSGINGILEIPIGISLFNGIYGPSFQIPGPPALPLLGLAGLMGTRRRRG